MAEMPPLPPGFVLDQAAPPAPPSDVMVPGFNPDVGSGPPEPEPSLLEHAGRKLALGTQAVGRGAADLIGMPVDLAAIPVNLGRTLFGYDPVEPVGGSESISEMVGRAVEGSIGRELPQPETPAERILYEAERFGAAGAGAGGMLGRAAQTGRITDKTSVIGPYAEAYAREPAAAMARDVGGGLGAGTAIGAVDEVVPEDSRYSPVAEAVAGLLGGLMGTIVTAGPRGALDAGHRVFERFSRSPNVAPDPETHVRPTRSAERKAAEIAQSRSVDPEAAARNIEEGAAFSHAEGLPTPTAGLMSNDEGMISLEKRARLDDPVPFQRRDREVRTAAGEQLRSMRPEGEVDLSLPGQEARRQVEAQRGAAEQGVTSARAGLARVQEADQQGLDRAQVEMRAAEQAGEVRATAAKEATEKAKRAEQDIGIEAASRRELTDDASKRLDKAVVEDTMRPMQAEQSALYAAIPDDIELDATPLVEAARQLRAEAPRGLRAPSLDPFDESAFVTRDGSTETIGFVTSGDLKSMRPRLAKSIQEAQAKGDFERADALKRIKQTAEGMIDDLPESQQAVQFTREQMGPKFGQGAGGELRRDINRDDLARTKTPPTVTASRFLKTGAGGEEVAADLQRILRDSPARAQGQAAARDYILSDLAKVVGRDNTIEPRALRHWIANRQGALREFPEIRAEVDGMLRDVMARKGSTERLQGLERDVAAARGADKRRLQDQLSAQQTEARAAKGRMQGELERRVGELKRTEREIADSALSLILDKDPQKAVASVFGSRNPDKAMAEVVTKLGREPGAAKAWKAAVSDYLERQTTNTATGQTLDASDPVSWAKSHRFFKDHQKTLARVFTPEEMNALTRVSRLMEPYTRLGIQATAGSPTAENLTEHLRPLEAVLRWHYGHLRTGGIMRSIRLTLSAIPGLSQAAATNRLLHRMQLEPELAQHILRAPTDLKARPAWNKRLRRFLVGAEVSRGMADQGQDEE